MTGVFIINFTLRERMIWKRAALSSKAILEKAKRSYHPFFGKHKDDQ